MAVGFFDTETIDPAAPMTPQAIERKRRMAELLMKQGSSDAPIQSWTQGAANVAKSLLGAYQMKNVDSTEAAGQKAAASQNEQLVRMLLGDTGGGDSSAGMAGASPGMDPSSPGSGASGEYKKVVAQIESGGNPNARNKDSGSAGL